MATKMAAYVVILAGGSGTRFWPKSRKRYPKQFLAIGGEETLLRQTARRVVDLVGWEKMVVVTAKSCAEHVARDLPELPVGNVLVEPEGRNTAAAIGWATWTLSQRDENARLVVLPADHHVGEPEHFRAHIESALLASENRIVLMGLVPTRPETGYGYIQRGESMAMPKSPAHGGPLHDRRASDHALYRVSQFVEKPDRPTAENYIASGDYLWNSGIFVFDAATMMKAVRTYLPDIAAGLDAIVTNPERLEEIYPKLTSISIDYGVMEKAQDIAVLAARFAWSDVGSWDAAIDIERPDARGNVTMGDALVIGTERSYVDARAGRLVALVDVDDLIVVDSPDAVLVVRRGHSQHVRNVVDSLQQRQRKELL